MTKTALPMALLALLSVTGAAPQQDPGTFNLRGPNGWVRLRGFTNVNVNLEEGVPSVATAAGPSVILEDTGSGLTLIGKAMSVTMTRNARGETIIQSATVADGATAVIDTAVAAQARKETAQRNNKPAPADPREVTRGRLESERFTYARSPEGEGVLTIPADMSYTSTTDGTLTRVTKATEKEPERRTEVAFNQLLKLNGKTARLTLSVPETPDIPVDIRTGRVEGPVTFNLVRSERSPDPAKPGELRNEATNVTGKSDLFLANFLGAEDPTLTAEGNVVVDGETQAFIGRVTGARAVITLDRTTRQPKNYNFSGQPAVTRVNQKAGGN